MSYNYYEAIEDDVRAYLRNYGAEYDDEDTLLEDLWAEDEVTGNGPYGYGDEETCAEYLCGNLDLLFQALDEFGYTVQHIRKQSRINIVCDAIIRLHLLPEIVYRVWGEQDEEDV